MKSEEEIRKEIRKCEDILHNVTENEKEYRHDAYIRLKGLTWVLEQ